MKRTAAILLACALMVAIFAACGTTPGETSSNAPTSSTPTSQAVSSETSSAPEDNGEIVNGKFVDKRSISVEVYDRNIDGGTPPEDNFYTDFIKDGVLNDLNIEVTFDPIPRWTEVEQLNNRLAAGDAPDVCVTYSYPTIKTYADMGAVHDLTDLLLDNKELLPNLWSFLGEEYLFWHKDPKTSETYAIMATLARNIRINTFVRQDWLEKLNLDEPKTEAEFEAMLYAFKENATELLGNDASQIIPLRIGTYVSWDADPIIWSKTPSSITHKEDYSLNFDSATLLPGTKDAMRLLNKWYNDGLVWQDFYLYESGDQTGDNLTKAGFVGSYMGSWDLPYRGGEDGIHNTLRTNVAENAGFIAIEPFLNDKGVPFKRLSTPSDRSVFLPHTNSEPLASLMYVDWITKFENRFFLQFGEEGVTHNVKDGGVIEYIAVKGDKIMNSPNNIDYTTTLNGIDTGDEAISVRSLALGYGFVDESFIVKAYNVAINHAVAQKYVNVGTIEAEQGIGPALREKSNTFLTQSICAKPDQFDSVFDAGLADYLSSGGQAVVDERIQKWEEFFGDKTMLD